MQPRLSTLFFTLLPVVACAHDRRAGEARDSALASPAVVSSSVAAAPLATSLVATPSTATLPLSHDSVVTWPADTGVHVGPDGRLRFPIVFAASCEGEDCETSFKGLACAAVDLRAAADTAAPVVARVARGDSVHVKRTDLHLVRPGIVVAKRPIVRASETGIDDDRTMPRADTLRIAAGDTVWLLQYEQLGWWRYWWKGRTTDGGQFWGVPADEEAFGEATHDTSRAVARSQPATESWWLLDDGKHPIGWWRADSTASLRSVYNMEHWDEHCPGRPAAGR
ncbi:MAG: hypothetical protein HOQ09_04405 [Gemmatimonadaceae bacterium]|nr:hypothetical protein [Gemmatimonadaceae bacterium]